jgi:hypothetical protein
MLNARPDPPLFLTGRAIAREARRWERAGDRSISDPRGSYSDFESSLNSVRRFLARPAAVSFSPAGFSMP